MEYEFILVFYILRDWQGYHRRPMIEALSSNCRDVCRILCVEPPMGIHSLVANPNQVAARRRIPAVRQISSNLWVFRPYAPVPNSMPHPFPLSGFYRACLSKQVCSTISSLGPAGKARIAYLTRPDHHRFVGVAREDYLVYECRDNHTAFPTDGSENRRLKRLEERMLRKADLVFATSEPLLQRMREQHSNAYLLPNGANYELLSGATNELPSDLASVPAPRIGYCGRLVSPFDFSVVKFIAEQRPSWSLVLLGAASEAVRRTLGGPNVHFLGVKKYEELPSYFGGFDVAILPRLKNVYTDCENPLKIWEYLSAGKLVVSSDLSVVRRFEDPLYVAASEEEFLARLHEALKGNHSDRIARGKALARQYSWVNTTRKMVDTLRRMVNG